MSYVNSSLPTRRDALPREILSTTSLIRCGIPRFYVDKEIDDFYENEKIVRIFRNYIKHIHDMYEDCINLTLFGSNGSGKTLISSIILKSAYRNHYTFKLINFPEYIALNFKPDKTYQDLEEIEKIQEAEFLVIDELGKEYDTKTDANVNLLIQLMKHREVHGLPTIICTNLDLEDMRSRYGETINSLTENSVKIMMVQQDRRKESFKSKKNLSLLEE